MAALTLVLDEASLTTLNATGNVRAVVVPKGTHTLIVTSPSDFFRETMHGGTAKADGDPETAANRVRLTAGTYSIALVGVDKNDQPQRLTSALTLYFCASAASQEISFYPSSLRG